jgi:hypothetical protein
MESGSRIACTNRRTLVFFCWQMRILFMISAASLFVLLWASVAVVRRIHSHRIESPSSPPRPGFSEYLFSAVEEAKTSQATFRQHQAFSNPASRQSHPSLDDEATSPKRG